MKTLYNNFCFKKISILYLKNNLNSFFIKKQKKKNLKQLTKFQLDS